MEPELSQEGAYDAPVDHLPPPASPEGQLEGAQQAAERQQRMERVRQRRLEMAQSPSSVSSALTKTSVPAAIPTAATPSPAPAAAPASAPAALRLDLIQDAVDFLNNPRVASAPMATKRKFLTTRKGLTEAEVDEAVKRSSSATTTAVQAPVAPQAPAAPPPPQYYPPPVMYQPPPPQAVQVMPNLRAIALLVVLCVGVGSTLYHLFKRYVLSYWFPKKVNVAEKIEQLESKLTKATELAQTQATEAREAVIVVRNFLENQVTDWSERQRLEELRHTQDEQKLSELKKEVSTVRHLLPSVGHFSRTVKASALQTDVVDEIKNELVALKNAIKSLVSDRSTGRLSGSGAAPSTPVSTSSSTILPEQPTEPTPSAVANAAPAPADSLAAAPASTASSATGSRRTLPSWMRNGQPNSSTLPSWQLEANGTSASPAAPATAPVTNETATLATPVEPTSLPTSSEASSAPSVNPSTPAAASDPPYSQSYMNILQMVKKGIVPPDAKMDVDDSVRDPDAPLENGTLSNRSKPWQQSAATSEPIRFNVKELRDEDDDDLARPIGPQSSSPE